MKAKQTPVSAFLTSEQPAFDDIKRLKQQVSTLSAELDLLNAEFFHVLDNSNHAIRIINADRTIQRINRAFAKMSGFAPEAAQGKKCWEVFRGPLCQSLNCDLCDIFKDKNHLKVDFDVTTTDGISTSYIVTAVPFRNSSGKILGIVETYHDTSRRKLLKNEAEESEDRYRSLVELSGRVGEAIVMLQNVGGQQAVQTFVSREWERITGYSRDELTGMPFGNLLTTRQRRASLARHNMKILGGDLPETYELTIIRKDGTPVTVELNSAHSRYKGQPVNVAYIRDITQRKIIEKELNQYRQSLENIVGHRTRKLQVLNLRLKEEADRRGEAEQRYKSLFNEVPTPLVETDWSRVKAEIDILTNTGITNFRQYLEKYPREVSRLLDMVGIISMNKAFLRFWGVSSQKAFFEHKEDIYRLWSLGYTGNVVKKTIIAIANGSVRGKHQWIATTLQGKSIFASEYFYAVNAQKNNYSQILTCVFDLSAEKQLRDKTRELLKLERRYRLESEKQLKQRMEFIHALVHEIKTPLTSMVFASEALKNQAVPPAYRKLAANIHTSTMQLNKRINELLDLAKGDVGLLRIKPVRLDCVKLLSSIIAEYDGLAGKKKVAINFVKPRSCPVLTADRDRFTQIIQNLLNNALAHSPGNSTVAIKLEVTPECLEVRIIDQGPGVNKLRQANLFEPYNYLPSGKFKLAGLGLGLALCRTFVELHNGRIWYEPVSPKGSCFGFCLPLNMEQVKLV